MPRRSRLGQRYVQYINRTYRRSMLWGASRVGATPGRPAKNQH